MDLKKKFPKELLEAILNEDAPGYTILDDLFIEKSRWLLHHELIFREPGQQNTGWSVLYTKGATELQDRAPFEDEPDNIECNLVKPVEKTIIEWVEVNE